MSDLINFLGAFFVPEHVENASTLLGDQKLVSTTIWCRSFSSPSPYDCFMRSCAAVLLLFKSMIWAPGIWQMWSSRDFLLPSRQSRTCVLDKFVSLFHFEFHTALQKNCIFSKFMASWEKQTAFTRTSINPILLLRTFVEFPKLTANNHFYSHTKNLYHITLHFFFKQIWKNLQKKLKLWKNTIPKST